MICFDTNAAIALLEGPTSPIRPRFDHAVARGVLLAVSSIVLFELWYGVAKSVKQEGNARKIGEFLSSPVQVWNFDPEDAEEAGEIREVLRRLGTPIGPYDVLIAAQARRRNALLVSANTREFARVPGLHVENWIAT
jgi:tRNA(fMet)-specific endonuclease VapC